ncbi:MAG TPA: nickel-binding protein [Polyangia bacterium]|nr:nickel-binding protein [Polyangia bacterium]
MPYLLVEYDHDPPITLEALTDGVRRLEPCLAVRGIRKLRSWVSTDRRWGICEYEAADAESVREAYRSADVKFLRVRSADLFGPP